MVRTAVAERLRYLHPVLHGIDCHDVAPGSNIDHAGIAMIPLDLSSTRYRLSVRS